MQNVNVIKDKDKIENQNNNIENKSEKSKKPLARQSNIELLRILAMFLIVASHWGWAFVSMTDSSYTFLNLEFKTFFRSLGQCGVFLFVMISGYFMCEKKFNIFGLFKLFLQIFVLQLVAILGAYVLSLFSNNVVFDFWEMFKKSFFVVNYGYWFISMYVLLFLLSPFINLIIRKLNFKQYCAFLLVLLIFTSIMPSLLGYGGVGNMVREHEITVLIFIYCLGALVKLYPEVFKIKWYYVLLVLAISLFFHAYIARWWYNIQTLNNLNMIIMCLCIFMLFTKLKIKSRLVNLIGGTTLGVYILHENGVYHIALWTDILQQNNLTMNNLFPLFAVLSVAIVFLVCSLITIVLKFVIENPINKFVKKKFAKPIEKINAIIPWIEREEQEEIKHKNLFFIFIVQLLLSYIVSISLIKFADIGFKWCYFLFIAMIIGMSITTYFIVKRIDKSKTQTTDIKNESNIE